MGPHVHSRPLLISSPFNPTVIPFGAGSTLQKKVLTKIILRKLQDRLYLRHVCVSWGNRHDLCFLLVSVSLGALAGKIIMSMILAKFFITISFDGVYLYTAELFPTAIR